MLFHKKILHHGGLKIQLNPPFSLVCLQKIYIPEVFPGIFLIATTAVAYTRKRKIEMWPTIKIENVEIKYQNKAKYLGLTMDKGLTWKDHIQEITNKASKRVGILKYFANKDKNIPQKYLITLYKTLVRPIIEYGSEIWGDIAKYNQVKLDSIQHRSLTSALGVNRLAHRKDVNYEAKVLPLEFRREQQLFKMWQRKKDTLLGKFLKNLKNKNRLKYDRRKSYIERLKELNNSIEKLKSVNIWEMGIKEFQIIILEKWYKKLIEEEENIRNKGINYKILKNLKYEPISNNREVNAKWHQTRLEVLSLKGFLKSINKSKSSKCRKCKRRETINHFLTKCKKYEAIWEDDLRKKKKAKLNEYLNETKPRLIKRKIALKIIECFKRVRKKKKINC